MPAGLAQFLAQPAARHDHLCPRQVLGVRMGLAGLRVNCEQCGEKLWFSPDLWDSEVW